MDYNIINNKIILTYNNDINYKNLWKILKYFNISLKQIVLMKYMNDGEEIYRNINFTMSFNYEELKKWYITNEYLDEENKSSGMWNDEDCILIKFILEIDIELWKKIMNSKNKKIKIYKKKIIEEKIFNLIEDIDSII